MIDSKNATVKKKALRIKQKAKIEVYTWDHCPYCQKVIELLNNKGVTYMRYRIDGDEEARNKMSQRANGRKTVPQVFIDEKHVGGCDDTFALEEKGELHKLLFE